jgi:outer membrane protein assembly factor BamB
MADATHLMLSARHTDTNTSDDIICLDLTTGRVAWKVSTSQITGTAQGVAMTVQSDGAGHEIASAAATSAKDPDPAGTIGVASFATLDPATGRILSVHANLPDSDLQDVENGFLIVAADGTITSYATTDLTKSLATGTYISGLPVEGGAVFGDREVMWTWSGYVDAGTGAPVQGGPSSAGDPVTFVSASHQSLTPATDTVYRCKSMLPVAVTEEDALNGASDRTTYAVSRWDPASGKALWKASKHVSDCRATTNGQVDVFQTLGGGLLGLDHATGKELWARPKAGITTPYMQAAGPALVVRTVGQKDMAALSFATGKVLWSKDAGAEIEDSAGAQGVYYVATAKTLTAYQASDGTKLWRVKLPKGLGDDPSFFSANGALYLGAMIGQGAGGDFVQVTAP